MNITILDTDYFARELMAFDGKNYRRTPTFEGVIWEVSFNMNSNQGNWQGLTKVEERLLESFYRDYLGKPHGEF